MNTPVSFEIKQLLYDKGWRYELGVDETGNRVEHSLAEQRWNEGDLTYIDITIAEIVMWLYEKHGIWIGINKDTSVKWANDYFNFHIQGKNGESAFSDVGGTQPNSPTEAYEAAIKYTLKNLI